MADNSKLVDRLAGQILLDESGIEMINSRVDDGVREEEAAGAVVARVTSNGWEVACMWVLSLSSNAKAE